MTTQSTQSTQSAQTARPVQTARPMPKHRRKHAVSTHPRKVAAHSVRLVELPAQQEDAARGAGETKEDSMGERTTKWRTA